MGYFANQARAAERRKQAAYDASPEGQEEIRMERLERERRAEDAKEKAQEVFDDFLLSMNALAGISADRMGSILVSTNARDRDFMKSLCERIREGNEPTEKQIAVIRKIAEKTTATPGAALCLRAQVGEWIV